MLLQQCLGLPRFQQHMLNNWKPQHKTVQIQTDNFSEKRHNLIGERDHIY